MVLEARQTGTGAEIDVAARFALLIALLSIGLFSKNQLLISSTGFVLAIFLLRLWPLVDYLETGGVELGIFMLTIAVLAPLASGRIGFQELTMTFRSSAGVAALLAGTLAAYLTGQGVGLLRVSPQVVFGLTFGSILGTAFLRGIPAGPLVAAGMAAVLWRLLGVK